MDPSFCGATLSGAEVPGSTCEEGSAGVGAWGFEDSPAEGGATGCNGSDDPAEVGADGGGSPESGEEVPSDGVDSLSDSGGDVCFDDPGSGGFDSLSDSGGLDDFDSLSGFDDSDSGGFDSSPGFDDSDSLPDSGNFDSLSGFDSLPGSDDCDSLPDSGGFCTGGAVFLSCVPRSSPRSRVNQSPFSGPATTNFLTAWGAGATTTEPEGRYPGHA